MENSKNKILLDCRFWGPSHTGLGRYTQELVLAMLKLKLKFELVALSPKKIPGIETLITHARPYSYAEQWQLLNQIRLLKPDLTHFLHFNVPLMFNSPFVVTVHDLIKHHSKGLATSTHWPGTYWLKRWGYHLVVRHAVTRAQKIIVPSHWVKEDILAYYPVAKGKIHVISEAANKIYFQANKQSRSPLPFDYFIYVGNAYPHKNVVQLIKAMKILAQKHPEVKLVIVTGRDWFYQRLRALITHLNAQKVVKLKDFSSDAELAGLYHHSLAFTTASRYEGFGLPGIEAMAAGTLVLASRKAALPSVYAQAAEYFDPENLDEIVKKMEWVINLSAKKRKLQIDKGVLHASKFSWEKAATETIKIYEDCLSLRSGQ
jgi:glycosyltransferase involved in cell wall biosynthesis